MAEKDMTEKTLEAYNDVFADIINVLLFHGERLVKEEDLEDETPRSMYKADGRLHEEERDVAKRWKDCGVRIALFGIENQTRPEPNMPVRVIGYDGAAYRSQLLRDGEKSAKCYPVVTVVLYFGYDKHWNQPLTLYDCFHVPEELRPYVNDYRINLFEIAWLSDEQLSMFQSDFKYVADYCVQLRKKNDYSGPSETVAAPNKDTINHYDEVFKLFTVMTGDTRFEEAAGEVRKEGGPRTVCEVLDRIEARGEARGRAIGEARGEAIGEARGRAIGEVRGRENTLLVSVKNLMKSTKWTAEQAMDAMGISAAEQKELKAKLNL